MAWSDSFDVYDEMGRKIFCVKANRQAKKKLKIYEARSGKSVATVKRCEENYPGVEIKHGAEFISIVNRFLPRVYRIDLGFSGWCAAGNFDDGRFKIFDASDHPIATVSEEIWCGKSAMRCIESVPDFCLLALTFVLAIDVQVSESCETDTSAVV